MKLGIGSDHAGYNYKSEIIKLLERLGHTVIDFGTDSTEPVDFPRFIRPVAEAVAAGNVERGIVLGGSGNGEAMCANRVKGVGGARGWVLASPRVGRPHNDGHVLWLGQRVMARELALEIVQVWLDTPFEGGRHVARLKMLDE